MQGRFKSEGSAAGDPELRGASGRGSAFQRAQKDGDRPGRNADTPDRSPRRQTRPEGEKKGTATASKPEAKSAPNPGSRLALRNWRISTRLVSLVALPVAAATTLGVLRIENSLDDVERLENMQLLTKMTEHATELAAALQEERDRSAGPLVSTGNAKDDAVVAPREEVDRAKAKFNEATAAIKPDDPAMAGVHATVVDIQRRLNRLNTIRERAYEEPAYVSQTVNSYNQLIESLLSLSLDMAQATSSSEMIRSTRALAAFSAAKEYASIQRAVIAAGLARKGGPNLSTSDRLYAKTAAESESAARSSFVKIYGTERALELTRPLDGGMVNITQANQFADRVLKDPDGIRSEERSYMDWFDQDKDKLEVMANIEAELLGEMEQQARKLSAEASRDAWLNGVLILLVLGISLAGAFVVARSMVRSLRRLQDTAQEVAHKRLPELVKQLSEAEPQDVDTSVESVGVHTRDEIGKVAAAFDDVHREAVRLAGEQALLRGNVNAMFTNLSRRSQGLIQRQLSLISELESREADPDQLSALFKLDHLATRMRRNGENLLVLAGEEPGRRWTRPVPLVDVLRAAASEVEQYERIELQAVPSTEVAGRVVNDLVHLLAELLENATSFSSPQTKVKVTGHALPDGRVLVEIHDTGIGLSPEDLSAINERLANPPTVDVSVSRRMGLFVVGRLSLRHGIRVQLRPSDSGGTTALVMLPVEVTQGGAAKQKAKQGADKGGATAALQRETRGSGDGKGSSDASRPAAGRLGSPTQRGQVATGTQRPALPTQGDASGQGGSRRTPPGLPQGGGPGGGDAQRRAPAGRTASGLPTRTPSASLPGGGPGAATPPGGGSGGPTPNLFEPGAGRRGAAAPPRRTASDHPGGPGLLPDDAPAPSPVRGGPGAGWGAQPAAGSSRPQDGPEPAPGHDTAEPATDEARPRFPAGGPAAPVGAAQGPGDTAQFPRPEVDGPAPRESETQAPASPQDTGQYPALGPSQDTGPSPAAGPSQDTGPYPALGPSQDTGQYPALGSPQPGGIAEGVPAAPVNQEERTPIFEAMESNWFNARRPRRPQGPTQQAAPGGSSAAGQGAAGAQQPASDPADQWGSSPNDERWRRAEQLRQPTSGGVTTSGLPRRVPRANLVAGTAQQRDVAQTGPQVSRAPDDVRGRLTSLRRGVQQGRQAGSAASGRTDRGFGPTYQQER